MHDIKYSGIIPYSKISADLKKEFLQGNYFLKKSEYTDVSLFKKEFGYSQAGRLRSVVRLEHERRRQEARF